jgi:hypothetical protein
MKFVVNTNYNKSAGTTVLEGVMKRLSSAGHELTRNDWGGYANYDIAIFMAPDSQVREAKSLNPGLTCGIFDPKVTRSWQIKEVKAADFLIVSSIEQKEFFLKYNKNTFIYYMFPDTPEIKKTHSRKDRIVIGYHGNKQHLDAMRDVSWALDQIADKHNIELRVIYNLKQLGKWRLNRPKKCPVVDVQWEKEKFVQDLSQCDIGIVPSIIPAPHFFARPLLSFFYDPVDYKRNDYVNRYKMSNNPGRMYVFSQINIPIVTDFTPSACQIIKDGESGFLAGTREGWKYALENLINDHELRTKLSACLKSSIDSDCSIDLNFKSLMQFIAKIKV